MIPASQRSKGHREVKYVAHSYTQATHPAILGAARFLFPNHHTAIDSILSRALSLLSNLHE